MFSNLTHWNVSITHLACPFKTEERCGRNGNKSGYDYPDERATCTRQHCPIIEEFEFA